MIYSKTMQLSDYNQFQPELRDYLEKELSLYKNLVRFEHEHRMWEYATALSTIIENAGHTILDVGSASSLLYMSMIDSGYDVLGLDLEYNAYGMKMLQERSEKQLRWREVDFQEYPLSSYDIVTCISVIEHVPNDIEFFKRLLLNSRDLVILTTDFHPSGKQIVGGHIRTYNKESLENLIQIAKESGFSLYNNKYNYDVFEPNVNGCDFASLILRRN